MSAVKLERDFGSNKAGEVCGFPADVVEFLLANGFARKWPPEPEPAPPKPVQAPQTSQTADRTQSKLGPKRKLLYLK